MHENSILFSPYLPELIFWYVGAAGPVTLEVIWQVSSPYTKISCLSDVTGSQLCGPVT